jgi:uncharacterized membrane protein YeaQ/YmgE (transglycosylase-associated protein family)
MFLIVWLIYGLIVGLIVRAIHPGEEPTGFLWTLGIGVAGSYVGGFLNWVLGWGGSPISPSGIIMGIIGGVIFCWIYTKYIAGNINV